jgi:hypothetical protein
LSRFTMTTGRPIKVYRRGPAQVDVLFRTPGHEDS